MNSRHRLLLTNLLLSIFSMASVFLLAMLLDRGLGFATGYDMLPGETDLILPPNSAELWRSSEFTFTIRSNALGIRDNPVPPKAEGTCRVVVLGDSFTLGWGVELEDTWVKRVEAQLRAEGRSVEVLNLGKPGGDIPAYVKIAQRAIPILQPDIVVVAMLQGDDLASAWNYPVLATRHVARVSAGLFPNITRFLWRPKNTWRPRDYAEPGLEEAAKIRLQYQKEASARWVAGLMAEERERFEKIPADFVEPAMSGELNFSLIQLAVASKDFMMNAVDGESGFCRESQAHATEALKTIRQLGQLYGAETLALSVPHGIYVNRPAMESYARLGLDTKPSLLSSDLPDQLTVAAAASAGMETGTFTQFFRAHSDDPALFYKLDGHYTPAGHKLLAEAVIPWMKQQLHAHCP